MTKTVIMANARIKLPLVPLGDGRVNRQLDPTRAPIPCPSEQERRAMAMNVAPNKADVMVIRATRSRMITPISSYLTA